MASRPDVLGVARAVVAVGREKRVTVVAASLAYYSFNSLIPFALFVFVALSFLDGFGPLAAAFGPVVGAAPAEVESFIREAVGDATGRRRTVAIAVVVFVWSALRMFRAVHGAFGEVYETRGRGTVPGRLLDTLLVFLTVALAVVLLATVGVAFAFLVGGETGAVLGPVVLFLALVAVFFPMYYRFPETAVTVREALPGTVVAAGAWTAASVGFRLYAEATDGVRLYGIAGAVLLVLTWLYVGGLVLLVGAILNAVLAGRVEPDPEWLPPRPTLPWSGRG